MLGSFFDLRREVEAIAARRERQAAERVYEDFDHKMSAFLRSVTPGSPSDLSRDIMVPGASAFEADTPDITAPQAAIILRRID